MGEIIWRCDYYFELATPELSLILLPSVFMMLIGTIGSVYFLGVEKFWWKGRFVFGCGVSVIIALLLVFGFCLMHFPPLGSAHSKAMKISCASNLNKIGLSLKAYANDNAGYFPSARGLAGFEMLRKGGYLTDPKLFVCPNVKILPAPANAPLAEANVSYVYFGNDLNVNAACQDLVLACDKLDNHDNYGNILFIDGHFKGFAGENWQRNAFSIKKPAQGSVP